MLITNDVVYISGPITAITRSEESMNRWRASQIYTKLLQAGIPAICPHTMGMMTSRRDVSYTRFIMIDIATMLTCQAVYMMPGWKESDGAYIEHDIAWKSGMPVHEDLDGLMNYYKAIYPNINAWRAWKASL